MAEGEEKTCYNCGKPGHIARDCENPRVEKEDKPKKDGEAPASEKVASEGRSRRGPRGEKTCYNCGKSGHIARDCENPRLEGDDRTKINKARAQYRRCFNCGKMGHISADCTKAAGNKACYNCGEDGHIAKDCSNEKTTE